MFYSCVTIPEKELKQHDTIRWDWPRYMSYGTNRARMQSYVSWPSTSKQKPDKLSEAGFFYTGKSLGG